MLGLILCLALEEKLHARKSVIAGTFAILCLFFGGIFHVLPFEDIVVGSHELKSHSGIRGKFSDFHEELHEIEIPPLAESTQELEDQQEPADLDLLDEEDAPPEVHVDGERILMPVYIPAVDWGVIAIILGSSLFVDITSKSGLFTWMALKVTKASGGDPLKLLIFYGLMTVLFSAVLNNVTAMIIIGSLTAVSLNKLGRSDKLLGFLLVEGLLTNVGGMLTLISSVPNIIVGTAANISFIEFVFRAAPYVVVATLITLAMAARMFKIHALRGTEEKAAAREWWLPSTRTTALRVGASSGSAPPCWYCLF